MRVTKRVVDGGKVTIPSDVRHEMDIEEGDMVEIEVIGVRNDD